MDSWDLSKLEQTGQSLVEIGAFVYENRAPTLYEIDILYNDMERALAAGEVLPIENDFKHWVENGYYFRSLYRPANAIVIGAFHQHAHLCAVIKGSMSIYSSVDGVAHLRAGQIFSASKNSQKVTIAHEDSIFITCTKCISNDVEEAAKEMIL